jgi:pimeloyl-ACP methyl ester carboxylesterase
VLDALELGHAHLVGGSFGGTLTLLMAAYHPARIDGMVPLGCPAFVPGMKAPAFLRLLGTTLGRRMAPGLLSSPPAVLLAAVLLGHPWPRRGPPSLPGCQAPAVDHRPLPGLRGDPGQDVGRDTGGEGFPR